MARPVVPLRFSLGPYDSCHGPDPQNTRRQLEECFNVRVDQLHMDDHILWQVIQFILSGLEQLATEQTSQSDSQKHVTMHFQCRSPCQLSGWVIVSQKMGAVHPASSLGKFTSPNSIILNLQ